MADMFTVTSKARKGISLSKKENILPVVAAFTGIVVLGFIIGLAEISEGILDLLGVFTDTATDIVVTTIAETLEKAKRRRR